jgi:hypothetical protein
MTGSIRRSQALHFMGIRDETEKIAHRQKSLTQ